jgi:hypothetical protein
MDLRSSALSETSVASVRERRAVGWASGRIAISKGRAVSLSKKFAMMRNQRVTCSAAIWIGSEQQSE